MKKPTTKQAEKICREIKEFYAPLGLEINPTITWHVPSRGITSAKINCAGFNREWARSFERNEGKKCFFQHGCRVHAFKSNVLLVFALENGN